MEDNPNGRQFPQRQRAYIPSRSDKSEWAGVGLRGSMGSRPYQIAYGLWFTLNLKNFLSPSIGTLAERR